MRLKLLALAAAVGMATFAAAPAQALLIDFTDNAVWGVGNIITPPDLDNQVSTASFTYPGDLTVTLTATGGNLTFNVPGSCGIGTYLACDGDGIGIGDDEISGSVWGGGDSLLVEFSHAVNVYTITLLDMFARSIEREFAHIEFNGVDTLYTVPATADNDGVGLLQVAMAALPHYGTVTSIHLTTPDATSDYALAALEVGVDVIGPSLPIPEPLTVSLFGLGLLSLALSARARPVLRRRSRV